MQPPTQYLFRTFDLKIGNYTIKPEYWHAVVIVILVFMLVLTFARLRYLKVKWGMQGFLPTLFIGFMLAIILEAGFILAGRTLFTELIGWENPPKPIGPALDAGREKLVNVLGVTEQIPDTYANENSTSEDLILMYTTLDQDEANKVKEIICSQ